MRKKRIDNVYTSASIVILKRLLGEKPLVESCLDSESIPMNKIDPEKDTYFKIGYSNESIVSDNSLYFNLFDVRVIESMFGLLAYLVTINETNYELFDAVGGFEIIVPCCCRFYNNDSMTNFGIYILKQIFSTRGKSDPAECVEQLNWILILVQECGKNCTFSLLEKSLCLISYLCKEDSRWKFLFAKSGFIFVLLDLWKQMTLPSLKNTLLQTISNIIVDDERVKEYIVTAENGLEPFMNAIVASSSNGSEKFLWALMFELNLVGSFLPIVISSEELLPSFNMDSLKIPTAELLFDATLLFTQPRKATFAEKESSQ